MRVALLADFPIHTLPGFEGETVGHHATWLPPLARELESRAGEVDLHWIACTKAVREPQTLRAWGQTFHFLPRRKLSVEMLTGYHRERRLLREKLSTLAPDLVHGWGTEQGYALAAADFSGPSLTSVQGILRACCEAAPMPWLTRLQARHESRALRRTRHLTVESSWGKAQLQPLAPHADIRILEYGVAPECFAIDRLPAAKPLALFVGSLTFLKGVDTLLAAFSDPRLRHIDLAILGSGDPTFTRRPLPPNITFHGHLPVTEVRDWMSRAWCLVHPTRADTSPNCVKEARVIGLPVVTTPNGGQTHYVEHGVSGFIHPAGDAEALVEDVHSLTADRETSLRMGIAGQAACRAALHPATTARQLLEAYAALP